jgi:nucleoid-associated protein YgaU
VRLLLGALILLALFSAAALWQRSWTRDARSGRASAPELPQGAAPATAGQGWSRVVLGRPSGGVPYVERAEDVQPSPPGSARDAAETKEPAPPGPAAPAKDVAISVRAGQTLSGICREHYGTATTELVEAVARYNHLSGPDAIREGQTILLPASETIRGER